MNSTSSKCKALLQALLRSNPEYVLTGKQVHVRSSISLDDLVKNKGTSRLYRKTVALSKL